LIDALNFIINHSNKSDEYARVVLLDFQKAFDKINHPLLIAKLELMGVPSVLTEWVTSFLDSREQCVKIGKHRSGWNQINGGVPQGTKLGPLLFIIFINDLRPEGKCIKFIDDTTLLYSNKVADSPSDEMQNRINHVAKWCQDNEMMLNAAKTKELVFHFGERPPKLLPLRVNSEPIESAESAKLLGLTITTNLKWDSHVESLVLKANKKLYLIIQLKRSGFSQTHLRQIYLSMVRPVLEYAVALWHPGLPGELG